MAKFTEEEKAARRLTLGASEVAAAIGFSPYASPHSVWLTKMGLADFEGNDATEAGDDFEHVILARAARHNNLTLLPSRQVVGPEPWMTATPDAFIEGGGLVETKLVGFETAWQWNTESDGVPTHYLIQAQAQLLVTGEPYCLVAAQCGTRRPMYYRITPDADLHAMILKKARAFWFDHVVTKIPPPVDGSEGAREMLKKLFPANTRPAIQADVECEEMALAMLDIRAEYDRVAGEERRLENLMKDRMREAEALLGNGWKATWRKTKAGTRPFKFTHEEEKKAKGEAA